MELSISQTNISIDPNRYIHTHKTVYGGTKLKKLEKCTVVSKEELVYYIYKKAFVVKYNYLSNNFESFEDRMRGKDYSKLYKNEYLTYLQNPDKFIFNFNQKEIEF